METEITKLSLDKALNFIGKKYLPKEVQDDDSIWVYAIAKVQKRTTIEEYVIVQHDYNKGEEAFIVIKDCGSTSVLHKIISIHPYEFVGYIPPLKTKDDLIQFLVSETKQDISVFKVMNKERLLNAVKKILILKHINLNR